MSMITLNPINNNSLVFKSVQNNNGQVNYMDASKNVYTSLIDKYCKSAELANKSSIVDSSKGVLSAVEQKIIKAAKILLPSNLFSDEVSQAAKKIDTEITFLVDSGAYKEAKNGNIDYIA